jgi:FkbM family methyltransferase
MPGRPANAQAYWQAGGALVGAAAQKALRVAAKLAAKTARQGKACSPWEEPATLADVVDCYRLLLGRAPDGAGLEHYGQRLHQGLRLGELVDEFARSVEFLRRYGLTPAGSSHPSEAVQTSLGFVLYVDPSDYAVGHTISLTRSYEPDVSSAVQSVLCRGATFVDIGANAGWFSMLAASVVGPTGKVLAVEPNPLNTELLVRSARGNGFENVEAFTVALADKAGMAALETDGSNGRVVPLDRPPQEPLRASYVVRSTTLDALASEAGVGRVDAMKLDVEGAEPLVLAGARGLVGRDRPVIVTEFYPAALDGAPWGSARGYLELLRGLGYRLAVIGPGVVPDDDAAIISMAEQKGQLDLLCEPA